MMTLVFLLEEPSAKILLEGLLPRVLPMDRVEFHCVAFEGKQDLEKQIVRKIRGWRKPNTRFIVLRDQNSADCRDVKSRLAELCQEANRPDTLIRIACREIESWYLGDLEAVQQAFAARGVARLQRQRKFRDPDRLGSPSREMQSITKGEYQKISGARIMAQHLRLREGDNKSHSFRIFISGVTGIVQQSGGASQ